MNKYIKSEKGGDYRDSLEMVTIKLGCGRCVHIIGVASVGSRDNKYLD